MGNKCTDTRTVEKCTQNGGSALKRDARRCCPETCGTGELTETECNNLGGGGSCTYPNLAQCMCTSDCPTAAPTARRRRRRLLETVQSLDVHCDLCRVDDEDSVLADVLKDDAEDDHSSVVRIFQGVSGAAVAMTKCYAGTYAPRGQLAQCLLCASGRFGNASGDTVCIECAPGEHTDNLEGATACLECAAGRHAPVSGSPQCFVCANDAFSHAGAEKCFKCPTPGVVCTDGAVTLDSDVWYDYDAAEGGIDETTLMYLCLPGRCIATAEAESGFRCKEGHTSLLCSVCEPGWALAGTSCAECIDEWWAIVMTAILLLAIVFVVLFIVRSRVISALKRSRGGQRSVASSVQRIFMTYAQTLSILSASKMQPPEEVTKVTQTTASFTDGISASAYPVQCATGWGFYEHTVFYMVSPVVAIIGIPLFVLLPLLIFWTRCVRPCRMRNKEREIKRRRQEEAVARVADDTTCV